MRRVTPDVQALGQAAISGTGPAGSILKAWERGDVGFVLCEEIVMEYVQVLQRRRIQQRFSHITPVTIAASAAALRQNATMIVVGEVPSVVVDDPDVNIVLACALEGGAECVVTRDKHLLRLGTHQGIPIVSTEAFAGILRGQVSEPLEFVYGGRG